MRCASTVPLALVLVLALALLAPSARAGGPESARRGAAGAVAAPAASRRSPASPPAPYCNGEYADDLGALRPAARTLEQQVQPYTYCVRTTAVYECPFYAGDGTLHTTRRKAVAHGTAFAYRQQDGGTLLLTNDHVATWPIATDAEHEVEDVPIGCRRISEAVKIVDDDDDDYERDDVPLARVVSDPQLDVAVLRARVALPIMPWRVGRSGGLRERNAVSVRGFPLGALQADNLGKVISVHDHDEFGEWDHDDFVVDALLSAGGSGSPVFAVSCKTGELELVGIFHAAYARGSALNVVVGIDQVRDLMTTLRRAPRPRADPAVEGEGGRGRLVALLGRAAEPLFPVGPLAAKIVARPDGGLVFEVFPRDFPARTDPLLVLEEAPPPLDAGPAAFGELATLWVGSRRGLHAHPRAGLDPDARTHSERLLEALRRNGLAYLQHRATLLGGDGSKAGFREAARVERALKRTLAGQQELGPLATDLAERLAPPATEPGTPLAQVLTGAPGSRPAPTALSPATSAAEAPAVGAP